MSDYTPRTTETLPYGYNAEAVLQAVISNLLRDANLLVDDQLAYLAKRRRAGGWQFTQQDYDALRKPLFDDLVRIFCDRLIKGLMDEDDEPPTPEGNGDE